MILPGLSLIHYYAIKHQGKPDSKALFNILLKTVLYNTRTRTRSPDQGPGIYIHRTCGILVTASYTQIIYTITVNIEVKEYIPLLKETIQHGIMSLQIIDNQ